jgi:hypothetical protein
MRNLRHFWKKQDVIISCLFLILFSFACHPPDKNHLAFKIDNNVNDSIEYNIVSSKDYKPMLSYDEKTKIVDTIIPPIIQSIRDGQYHGITAKEGLVKDALTAKRMAIAIMESIYGNKLIRSEEPINVSLIDNRYWFVYGTLPEGYVGGVAEILISKEDGRILYLAHGK